MSDWANKPIAERDGSSEQPRRRSISGLTMPWRDGLEPTCYRISAEPTKPSTEGDKGSVRARFWDFYFAKAHLGAGLRNTLQAGIPKQERPRPG